MADRRSVFRGVRWKVPMHTVVIVIHLMLVVALTGVAGLAISRLVPLRLAGLEQEEIGRAHV